MYHRTHLGALPRPRTRRRPATLGSAVNTGVSVAGTGLSIASKLAPALMTNPITAIAGAALSVFGLIAGIFGSHAAAVAREANDLNSAVPAFVQGIQAIMAAANQGQITAGQASSLVDQAVQTYYQQVGPIMKKGGSCPISSDCQGSPGSKPGGVNFSPCNGPCSVGCNYVEIYACIAKQVLAKGGTRGGGSLPAHAGFNGAPQFWLSYNPPAQAAAGPGSSANSSASPAGATTSGLPSWVLPVGALGALALIAMS